MNSLFFMLAVRQRCVQRLLGQTKLLQPASFPTLVQSCAESSQPVAAARLPFRVKVTAGRRYAWCACGHSKKQPFCDGAHKTFSPSISPVRFTAERDQTLLLCACKQTGNAPHCDGSHFRVLYRDAVRSLRRLFSK